jgi:hypothetical protein
LVRLFDSPSKTSFPVFLAWVVDVALKLRPRVLGLSAFRAERCSLVLKTAVATVLSLQKLLPLKPLRYKV